MPILEANWAELLDPILRKSFEQGYSRRIPMAPQLFNIQASSNSDEQILGVGAIGIDAWNNVNNAGRPSEVDFDKGYLKTYTHVEYGVDLKIQSALVADNKYPAIIRQGEKLGDSAAVKRETDAASVFNNAFSASYLGADAVALCSDSHPYSPTKSGTTQDNNGTLALTKDNVSTVRQLMMAYTDDNGNKVGVTPDLLLVPPGLEDAAITIAGSPLDPTSANNAKNPQNGRFEVKTWHYLTDSNAWFMIDSTLMKMSLDWFDREPVRIAPRAGDDTTYYAYWRAYMRYSYGFSDWRWVYGNNPS
jgi:Mu-like prophage major head subunit gpT